MASDTKDIGLKLKDQGHCGGFKVKLLNWLIYLPCLIIIKKCVVEKVHLQVITLGERAFYLQLLYLYTESR